MANLLLNSLIPSLLHPYVEKEGLVALSSFAGTEIRCGSMIGRESNEGANGIVHLYLLLIGSKTS